MSDKIASVRALVILDPRGNLMGVNLEAANLGWTAIGDVDLTKTRDLAMRHLGPSTIGTDALERTAAGLSGDISRQSEIETSFAAPGCRMGRSTISDP